MRRPAKCEFMAGTLTDQATTGTYSYIRILVMLSVLQFLFWYVVTEPCDIRRHGSLITFINGLGPLKTKSGGGFQGGSGVGDFG